VAAAGTAILVAATEAVIEDVIDNRRYLKRKNGRAREAHPAVIMLRSAHYHPVFLSLILSASSKSNC
jgi:hypothetical protein